MATDRSRHSAASPLFTTTHWSLVLTAADDSLPDAHEALSQLCQTYWYPLYCCVRRHGHSPEDAQDLTQAFFAKLLEKKQIALADQERGRFRTFLLRSLENFMRNQYRDATAQKRGGTQPFVSWHLAMAEERYATEPTDNCSPEDLYNKQWAGALLEAVLGTLRREFTDTGRLELFEVLEPHLWGDDTSLPHTRISEALNLTAVAVRVTLHRLRQRFHDLLRDEIARTLADPADVEDEVQYLRHVFTK